MLDLSEHIKSAIVPGHLLLHWSKNYGFMWFYVVLCGFSTVYGQCVCAKRVV